MTATLATLDSHNFYTMANPLQKKLKDEGWYFTDEGLKKVSDDGKISDIQGLVRKALDMDLKEISSGGLPTDFAKSNKLEVPTTGYIVQIQRILNISAPKCNQESKTSPRMLLLELTDGTTSCSAIELDHLPSLSVNTPPGTKILLKGTIKIVQGMLVLTPSTMKNCNGVVTAMVEKWEHERAMAKYAKGVKPNAGSAPPPWTPFGQKNQQTLVNEFKSLAVEKKNEETKEKDIEFVTNRNDAIAEILKTKQKKVFGGGNRQLVDHNVKKIMEKGYTEEQAKTSLKFARNNLEKAMGNLKRREDRNSSESTTSTRGPPYNKTQKEDRFGRKGRIEETEGAKPSNKVSLFDFLEDKIKIPKGTETTTPSAYSQPTTNSKTGAKPSDEPYPKQHYRSDDYQPSNRTSNNRNTQSINNGSNSQSQSQIDNRSKFENNISASFASRQKKEDDPYPSNSRNYNDARANKWSSKPNMANSRQNAQETSSGSYNKAGNARPQSSSYPQNSYQNAAPTNSAYGQRFSKNFNETGKPSRYEEKPQHPRNEPTDRRNNAPYNVNQLTEATASMKLSNNKRPPYNNQPNYTSKHQQAPSQQTSRQQQSQNHPAKNAPTPNGYDYNPNPYKIMGFQNKETNEYALNVLKNQNFDALPPTVLGKQPSQPMPAEGTFVPMPANRNFVVPPQPTATAVLAQPFIPAVVNTQPFNWTWKEHDICFAKYWEDQRYYNAEITAVTNKTCVVQFMEYGNYEEVLLSDCLPINDANIQSINQYNNNMIHDQNVQYYQQQQQQQQQHRPIYVTPAQRGAK